MPFPKRNKTLFRNYKKPYKKPVTKDVVSKMIKSSEEHKFSALDYQNLGLTSTFAIASNPTAMLQGDTANLRTGNVILVDRIEWNLNCTYGDGINVIRLMLICNRQANQADVNSGNLFNGFATAGVYSMYNPANPQGYRVLFDKQFTLSSYGLLSTSFPLTVNSQHLMKGFKAFKKPIRVQYNGGNSGTISDIQTNAIQLVAFSDSTAVPHPTLLGSVRIRYRDA